MELNIGEHKTNKLFFNIAPSLEHVCSKIVPEGTHFSDDEFENYYYECIKSGVSGKNYRTLHCPVGLVFDNPQMICDVVQNAKQSGSK